jgi:hypothetical protein
MDAEQRDCLALAGRQALQQAEAILQRHNIDLVGRLRPAIHSQSLAGIGPPQLVPAHLGDRDIAHDRKQPGA